MPTRIEDTDIRGSLNESLGGAPRLSIPGAGQQQFAAALGETGQVAAKIANDTQMRHNELVVNDAMLKFREFRRNALLGDQTNPGALQVRGTDVVGVTERTGQSMKDQLDQYERGLENTIQKNAFRKHASRILASTIDTVALHEADEAEKTRVAAANANFELEMEHYVSSNPTAFLEPPEDSAIADQRAHILRQTEDWLLTTQPELDDETVQVLAIQAMADHAHQAAMGLVTNGGPLAISETRKFLDAYSPFWSPEQTRQLKAAIDHETGFGIMQKQISEQLAAAEVDGIDALEARARAMEAFRSEYREATGSDPLPSQIDEMGDRILREFQLVETHTRKQEDAYDNEVLGGFYKALTDPSGNAASAEAAYREAWRKAPTNRPSVTSVLERFRDNFDESGTAFASTTSSEGWRFYALSRNDIVNAPDSFLWEAVSQMEEKHARSFIDRWNRIKDEGHRDTLWPEMERAMGMAANLNGEKAPKKGTAEYGKRMHNLLEAVDHWRRDNRSGRDPSFNELRDMAMTFTYDADSEGYDFGGTKQTLNEFVLAPEPLTMADRNDRVLIHTAFNVLRTSYPVQYANYMAEIGSANDQDVLAALAADENRVAQLIKLGQGTPGFASTLAEASSLADDYEPPPPPQAPGARVEERRRARARTKEQAETRANAPERDDVPFSLRIQGPRLPRAIR